MFCLYGVGEAGGLVLATAQIPSSFTALSPHLRASAYDTFETRRDAAGKQRPVEAERQRQIAAFDHLVGLLWRARYAPDRDAALEDAGLGARHQLQHLGIINAAAFVDAGGEVAGSDHGNVDAGRRHDLVDAVDRLDMLD